MTENVEQKVHTPKPGLGAARWLLFLTFLHTIPSLFFVAIIIGFVPTAALLAGGFASLLAGDRESFAMGVWLTVPALIYCGLYYGVAHVLAKLVFRVAHAGRRTTVLMGVVLLLVVATLGPVYTIAGHGGSSFVTIIKLLEGFKVSTTAMIVYGAALLLVFSTLTVVQHTPVILTRLQAKYGRWFVSGTWFTAGTVAVVLVTTISLSVYNNRAWMICKSVAHAGHAWAQVCMARAMTGGPRGRVRSDVDAVTWYERAAEQGHLGAAQELLQITRVPSTRVKWLRVLAEDGDADAQFGLFDLLRRRTQLAQRPEEPFLWLRKAAEQNQPQAEFELGQFYAYGKARGGVYRYGVEKDLGKAREWWERAAEDGSGAAMKELAWRYEQGVDGFPFDPERAGGLYDQIAHGVEEGLYGFEKHTQRAAGYRERGAALLKLQRDAEQGDADAQAQLGRRILKSGRSDADRVSQGVAWLEKAGEHGDVESQYQLGRMFILGRDGVPKDLERGRHWWDRAAAQNHVRTLEYVADAHLDGDYGYPVDLLKAKPQIQVLVTAYREGGHGVEPNQRRANHWASALKDINRRIASLGGTYVPMEALRMKAQEGDAGAQYQLGRQLLESYSVDAHREAVEWWNKAAANGHHEAQFEVAKYYRFGNRFVQQDHRRAVELLELAVAGKHPKAMLELGLAYEKGRYGLPRDLSKAKALYEELVRAGERNRYGWNVDERFLRMSRIRLKAMTRLLDPTMSSN